MARIRDLLPRWLSHRAGKLVLTFSWQFNQWCGPWFLSMGSLGFLRAWRPCSKSKHPMRTLQNCAVLLDFDQETAEPFARLEGLRPKDPPLNGQNFSHIGKKVEQEILNIVDIFGKFSFPIFIIRMEINLRPLDKKNKRYTPFTQSKKIKILRS